ncbi:hypothetical protein OEZ85_000683 [Tetradesmus obliquus]|uniref:Major facilitator superfamily (MFS) profile domain-containing protein n=1 Tax=Tetradesmus obliquus TaxID=3088 RepID=A0ABY8UIW3_TETOB|nr:hypothetical protein OEZ85_000683 [Tetradesmus obliquus]
MFSIANAAAFFFWTFATVDPVSDHGWSCASAADAACAAVWQQSTPNRQSFCSLAADQWHWTSQDNLVAKFSLVCGDAWKVQFANSMTFFGAFLGAGVFGFLCDRLGRRNPLFLSTALIAVPMLASLAAPSHWAMAGLRAVTGVGAAGQAHCIFLLATEPVGPDFRGFAGTITLLFFTIGEFLMVALGFALPNWKHLVVACAGINVAALLLYPLVTESARWLLSKGRTEDATKALKRIARFNKSRLPTQPMVVSKSRSQI